MRRESASATMSSHHSIWSAAARRMRSRSFIASDSPRTMASRVEPTALRASQPLTKPAPKAAPWVTMPASLMRAPSTEAAAR